MADRDVEVVKSGAKFIATLRRIADALEQKEPVRIQVAGKRISIPGKARLSIEHEVEGNEAELELQLSWQPSAADGENGKKPAAKRVQRTAATAKPSKRARR